MPKGQFKEFILNQLVSVLTHMKQLSGKHFVPTEISESIVMPDESIMITLRCSQNIKNIPLDGWFTESIVDLAKKMQVRTVTGFASESNVQSIGN